MFDFLTPEKATLVAQETHLLALLLAIIGVIAVALVYISIYRNAVKYKRGSDADRSQQPSDDSRKQKAYALIIFIVLLMIFVLSADTFLRAVTPPPNALEITAVGKRWMWKFQHYPDGQREINELHVPVGRPIKLTMTSQDVAHSLFIPALGVQQAVMPTHYTTAWFEVTTVLTQPGEYKAYRLAGGQYNGTAYAQMVGNVIALSPDDYQLWLAGDFVPGEAIELSPVEKGKKLFESNGCAACHKDDGTGIGPWFAGRYGTDIELESGGNVTVDDDYLHESILDPGAKIVKGYTPAMPPYTSLKDEELASLIAYIKSLSGVEGGGETGGEAAAAPAEMPEAYFTQGCVGCHGATLEGGVGPILGGLNPDYITANVREGNLESGMTAYDKSLVKDAELEQIALYMHAATLQDTGVSLSDDIKDALTQTQAALQAGDKDAVEKHLNAALTASVIGKSPVGVQNTFKFMINHLKAEDDWADYIQNRLNFLLAEEAGMAAPAAEQDSADAAETAAPAETPATKTEVAEAPAATPTPAPTATPVPPTPAPTVTAVPPTPVPPTATAELAPTATPVPPTAVPAALSILFPANNADIIVGRLSIIGSSKSGTEIEISDNGSVIGSAVSDITGEWIFATAVEQKGAHQLTAKPTDADEGEDIAINVVAATDSYNCASNLGINRGSTYIVGTCDTLGDISQAAGVALETLLSANPQIDNQHLIYPGDIIKLP